jgi:ABC-2 type transport system permease protein
VNTLRFFASLAEIHARMLRRRILALRNQSFLMVSVIVLFVAGYSIGSYVLFKVGFTTLVEFPGLRVILLDRMLYLFFAFLFAMLVFSNMIIGYASLFKSTETQWMLTLPVRHTDVFRWKLGETTVLASWAFVFLSAPLMLAYGSARQVSGWFYLKVLILFLPFVMIPSAIGSLMILLITRFLHRRMLKWTLFGLGGAVTLCVLLLLKPSDIGNIQESQMIAALNQLLRNSQITVQPILPSYWLAASVIAFGEGWPGKGIFFFMVLASNAMMATLVCITASARMFYDGWSRNHSQGAGRLTARWLEMSIAARRSVLESFISRLPRLDHATRALIVKDIKTFCRDTSQWSQFGIFFGLLGLYVLNLRNVAYDWKNEFWAVFVSFLNLGASSMTLATLTTRFVFPQFSLEGKRLWIVGMTPCGLKRVLLEKFWLSSIASATITLILIVISGWMLRVPVWLALLFSATVVLMSFALCGIAVGIGALFPNFGAGSTANRRDDNPAKIVSGFGGTFCFILSIVYIVLVIGAEALPMYLRFTGGGLSSEQQTYAIVGAWFFVSVISLVAISVPMTLALNRVEQMEM